MDEQESRRIQASGTTSIERTWSWELKVKEFRVGENHRIIIRVSEVSETGMLQDGMEWE